MSESDLYTGYKICDDLNAKEKCFRLHEYDEGNFNELFHQHVPKHRISADNAGEFMKALVVRHSPLGDPEILRTYINKRGKNPSAIELGQVVVEYPEPGVLRKYFSCGNIAAWFDEVISPAQFRAESNG
ncbi:MULTISPECIES: hypothetical protein [unclassified Methylophaga]|uniref:hypothetical protein n=1 Tax=unclassified Methylophaga TaxID=2629249 RepID=UPI00259C9D54|nr:MULTISPECIES: hypothetical protein [unclassified Methylophaga]